MKVLQDFLLFVERFCTHNGDYIDELSGVFSFIQDNKNVSIESLEALCDLTSAVLKKTILTKRIKVSVETDKEPEVLLNEDLTTFLKASLNIFYHTVKTSLEKEIQLISLKGLFSFLPLQAKCSASSKFPLNEFSKILECLICMDHNVPSLMKILEENLHFQDASSSLWKALDVISKKINPLTQSHVANILLIISIKSKLPKELKKTLTGEFVGGSKKGVGMSVRNVWQRISSVKLEENLHQELVLSLIEHIMPIVEKPITLTDYLMSCLNIDGPVALVALQGIFTLIQKFNINYPNVYNKLYNMFNVQMFCTPYKARFYYLSDIFLTSLYLPEAMVAGFIKRLARLSLMAPPEDIIIIMAFITNLLIRHPGLKHLYNNPDAVNVFSDPYNFEATDPSLSGACESSLWEVKLLQEHVLPSVSSSASFINQPLPSTERDLAPLLESTSSELFEKECKKKQKDPPLTFIRPSSLLTSKDESAFNLWSLESE